MGDRGRLVVPLELRERLQLDASAHLLLLDTPSGVVLLTREQAKTLVQQSLSRLDLVGELLAERRRQAAAEDAA
jgi:bifunctional DNA-binding transcriptional regulator/antitoxin component of YhaV-PrlF toxin-antitoxin module